MVGAQNPREFDVVLHPEPEGGYTVTVPALPGCISYGATHDEAITMITEAIELYVEAFAERGEPLPPAVQHERVRVAA